MFVRIRKNDRKLNFNVHDLQVLYLPEFWLIYLAFLAYQKVHVERHWFKLGSHIQEFYCRP